MINRPMFGLHTWWTLLYILKVVRNPFSSFVEKVGQDMVVFSLRFFTSLRGQGEREMKNSTTKIWSFVLLTLGPMTGDWAVDAVTPSSHSFWPARETQ